MDLLGFSLNMVTLLAITLSTGILVDDAIVEIENIVRHIRMGKSPYRGGARGGRRDRPCGHRDQPDDRRDVHARELHAVGLPGQFFKQFGITVSVQVLFSLLCARLITPMLAAYFLRPHQHEEKSDGRSHAALHPARHLVGATPLHHRVSSA